MTNNLLRDGAYGQKCEKERATAKTAAGGRAIEKSRSQKEKKA